jgi:dTDP-4-amino-4,6-dideoxygalactose transaminase
MNSLKAYASLEKRVPYTASPETEHAPAEVLALPSYPDLGAEQQQRVIGAVTACGAANRN